MVVPIFEQPSPPIFYAKAPRVWKPGGSGTNSLDLGCVVVIEPVVAEVAAAGALKTYGDA
jgi:hypothetical protein